MTRTGIVGYDIYVPNSSWQFTHKFPAQQEATGAYAVVIVEMEEGAKIIVQHPQLVWWRRILLFYSAVDEDSSQVSRF